MSHYTHFSITERRKLRAFLDMNLSIPTIAKRLNRHRSTLYREIERNKEEHSYSAGGAHKKTAIRRMESRTCKLEVNKALQAYVIQQLREGWSPEQIAGRMKLKKSKDYVCHETIYHFIYKQKDKSLYYCLPYKKPRREQRFQRKIRHCRFSEVRLITHRPEKINTRKRFGDWEGDCIEFNVSRKTNITTLVERKSRFLCLQKNEKKCSEVVMKNIRGQFERLPKPLQRTITFDQGGEFADYRQVEYHTRCRVYYCEVRSPWQKGSNENMNGRLRRYLPRSTDLSEISQDYLASLAEKMNNQPRKCLGFKTPKEVLTQRYNIDCRTST